MVIFAFLVAASFALSAVLVCRECGYESPEGSETCTHCKAKLPPPRPKSQPDGSQAENTLPSGKVKFMDAMIVENEIRIAKKHLDLGDFDVANLFGKNAAALEMIADPSVKGERSEQIIEIRKKSETGGMTVDRKCPACAGSGRYVMETAALDNKTTTIEVAGKSCLRCNGTGKILKPSTMDERRFKLGRGMNKYSALQQSRKFLSLGAAWIPAELDGKLSRKQQVQIKRAVAPPCADCMGLGRVDCAKCKGQGEIKCTFQGCVQGKVEVQDEGRLVKGKIKKTVKCKNCNGTGFVACIDCRAQGSLVCKKCNGSGERAMCIKCGGQGLSDCRRCQGSGAGKDGQCAECKGEGVLECTACGGDGRKR
ncbi:MAG: hypothetical protein A2283_23130 [Lentisphaerae bacterium RIFOXYA12_FULL_48_11]|nr:MAG: hypothetical protein A2283_23130 [Lentisphaerae bacterium RIFOXYA12_FULL_48_11]